MNDRELVEEIRLARGRMAVLPDQKVPLIVEVNGIGHVIDMVVPMASAQARQLYGVEGNHIVLYTNEETLK